MRHLIKAALLVVVLLVLPASARAQSVSCDFETFNAGRFCFEAIATPAIPSGRTIELAVGQGFNGTNAAKITINGCTGSPQPCTLIDNQGNVGWAHTMGGVYSMGAKFYIRMRLKFITPLGNQGNAKFVIRGDIPSERVMIHLGKPFNTNVGCQPSGEGNDYYGAGGGRPADTDPADAFIRATDYGFASTFTAMAVNGRSNYYMVVPTINIGANCAPFVIGPTTNVADVKPQNNAAITVGRWLHLQIGVTSGDCGAADYEVYANNNDEAHPTTRALNMNVVGALCRMGVSGWQGQMQIGGYWGQADSQAVAFLIDDFSVSPNFDPNFAPGSAPSVPAPLVPNAVIVP